MTTPSGVHRMGSTVCKKLSVSRSVYALPKAAFRARQFKSAHSSRFHALRKRFGVYELRGSTLSQCEPTMNPMETVKL